MANFLSISPNQTKFFPFVCLVPAGHFCTSDSVSAVSEGYQLNYCWILTLLSGPRICKLLNLCCFQLISIPYLQMSLFLLFWGKMFQQLNLENDIGRNSLLGHRKKIAKFLPLYLPLWQGESVRMSRKHNKNQQVVV